MSWFSKKKVKVNPIREKYLLRSELDLEAEKLSQPVKRKWMTKKQVKILKDNLKATTKNSKD